VTLNACGEEPKTPLKMNVKINPISLKLKWFYSVKNHLKKQHHPQPKHNPFKINNLRATFGLPRRRLRYVVSKSAALAAPFGRAHARAADMLFF